jgi:hypothetical protein
MVVLHNVVDLTKVLNEMVNEGHEATPESVQRLSPYMTEHVKRFGQYVLDMNDAWAFGSAETGSGIGFRRHVTTFYTYPNTTPV